jgi:hypothetical protein
MGWLEWCHSHGVRLVMLKAEVTGVQLVMGRQHVTCQLSEVGAISYHSEATTIIGTKSIKASKPLQA